MATKKFNKYYELFNPMAEFAIKNGMTSYHSDLMHDAITIYRLTENGAWNMMFAARTTHCGTDFQDHITFGMMEQAGTFDPNRPKAIVKYDGEFFYFITED